MICAMKIWAPGCPAMASLNSVLNEEGNRKLRLSAGDGGGRGPWLSALLPGLYVLGSCQQPEPG